MLQTDCLTKRYGRVEALRDLTLKISPGEIYGLLGPNGSGKTTTLRLLLGFLRPTSGTARIGGLDCWRRSLAVRRRVSYLPGELRLYPSLSGHQVLRFFAALRRADCLDRARQLAERLDLDLDTRVSAMSTGMRQKLGLAIVLAPQTEFVILDEPTSGLDPTSRLLFLQLLREAQADGRTVLLSSHVISEVEQVCHRVGLLRSGRLVADERLEKLRGQRRVVVDFAGKIPAAPPDLPGVLEATLAGSRMEMTMQGPMGPVLQWLRRTEVDDLQVVPGGLLALYQRYHAREQSL